MATGLRCGGVAGRRSLDWLIVLAFAGGHALAAQAPAPPQAAENLVELSAAVRDIAKHEILSALNSTILLITGRSVEK